MNIQKVFSNENSFAIEKSQEFSKQEICVEHNLLIMWCSRLQLHMQSFTVSTNSIERIYYHHHSFSLMIRYLLFQ
jgi:hypothetical protein